MDAKFLCVLRNPTEYAAFVEAMCISKGVTYEYNHALGSYAPRKGPTKRRRAQREYLYSNSIKLKIATNSMAPRKHLSCIGRTTQATTECSLQFQSSPLHYLI